MKFRLTQLILFSLLISKICLSQSSSCKHKLYLSWGYNKEWYSNSSLHFKQAALGNDLQFVNVKGNDKPGWNTGLFNKPFTIPQYNYRLGFFVNSKFAVELNFDHTKFIIPNQKLHLKGTLNNRAVDTFFQRDNSNLMYQLNNGANFFLFNFVYDYPLDKWDKFSFHSDLLLKAGIGFVYPHVENTILGNRNRPDFQFGGFDTGIEACYKLTFKKYVYLEYGIKTVHARYRNLKIYEGLLNQNLNCFEMILNLGIQIGMKH